MSSLTPQSMKNSESLLSQFLDKALSLDGNVELIKVLRSNTYKIGNANVLVRTASDFGRRYFFGINYISLEEISNLDNSFVAFVCGELNKTIFLPSQILLENLNSISHDRNGEFKIVFTRDMKLVLKGRKNQYDCNRFLDNWDILKESDFIKGKAVDPIESIHSVMQGRLLEIGKIRGFHTYCPDKSKRFNQVPLLEIATLKTCPQLQFSDYNSLRNIDTLWFRKTNGDFYPEYAFEVEFSTGVWSGFGRLASLREYSTKLIIVSHDDNKFKQVLNSFPEMKNRYVNISPEKIGLLYSAEINLIRLRAELNL